MEWNGSDRTQSIEWKNCPRTEEIVPLSAGKVDKMVSVVDSLPDWQQKHE